MEIRKAQGLLRDPFAADPLPKAYYYPSPERQLPHSLKAISIKPARLNESGKVAQHYENRRASPADEMFLERNHIYKSESTHHDPVDVDLNESWSSSERLSYLSSTGAEDKEPVDISRFETVFQRIANLKRADEQPYQQMSRQTAAQRLQEPDGISQGKLPLPKKKDNTMIDKVVKTDRDGKPTSSILQRYIDRFRTSAPMSREERERHQDSCSQDFWWLSPSHGENTDRSGQRREEQQNLEVIPLTEENVNKYSQPTHKTHKHPGLKSSISDLQWDKQTIELQEKAEKLLEKSSSTVLSADPAVSTDGLCSTFSDMSSMEEHSYRPAFTAHLGRTRPSGKLPDGREETEYKPRLQDKKHPDDPLYQWRLRRKMEHAQEMPANNMHIFYFLGKSEKEKQIDGQLEEFKRKLSGKSESDCLVHMKRSVGFSSAQKLPQNTSPICQKPSMTKTGPEKARALQHNDLLPRSTEKENVTQYIEAEKPHVDKINGIIPVSENEAAKNVSDERNVPFSQSHITKTEYKEADGKTKHCPQKAEEIKESNDDLHSDQPLKSGKDMRNAKTVLFNEWTNQQIDFETRKNKSGSLPNPKKSSSPKINKGSIDQAIGQVVKNHLFSLSTSMVLSSVESIPSVSFVDTVPSSSTQYLSGLPEQSDNQVEQSDGSEGEFEDDHLLQMLRRQRLMFEQQLQKIDQLLEEYKIR